MKIKRLSKYDIPEYPKGYFRRNEDNKAVKAIKAGSVSALLFSLLQGCDGRPFFPTQVVGNEASVPSMTETDARNIINDVFSRNNIQLQHDKELLFSHGEVDSLPLNLDGYNDSLRIGYEYISEDDQYGITDSARYISFTHIPEFEAAANDSGPYIKVTDPLPEDWDEYLENLMQTFIDSLKANGVI